MFCSFSASVECWFQQMCGQEVLMSNKCLWLSTMTFQTIVNYTFTGTVCVLLVIPSAPGYAFRAMVCCATLLLSISAGTFCGSSNNGCCSGYIAHCLTGVCCVLLLCDAWSVANWQDKFTIYYMVQSTLILLLWNQGLTRWYYTF